MAVTASSNGHALWLDKKIACSEPISRARLTSSVGLCLHAQRMSHIVMQLRAQRSCLHRDFIVHYVEEFAVASSIVNICASKAAWKKMIAIYSVVFWTICCLPISFTFIKHVLEWNIFTWTNTFKHAEFKSEIFPLHINPPFSYKHTIEDILLWHSKAPIFINQSSFLKKDPFAWILLSYANLCVLDVNNILSTTFDGTDNDF